MVKKAQKDIIELFLISVLWLAPIVRSALDYRIIISFVLFISIMMILFLLNKKQIVFILVSILLFVMCLVDKSCFFTGTVPVIMLYVDRYLFSEEKKFKENQAIINVFFTGTEILLVFQTIFLFIRTPDAFEIVWQSRVFYYTLILLFVMIVPLISSFIKSKEETKRKEMLAFRKISVMAICGIIITTYSYFLNSGFYNYELYMLKIYPWFIFVYSFIKNNRVYSTLIFEKTEKWITLFTYKQ